MLADILRRGADKARAAHRRVADHVIHLGLHQLHHHFDDVARRAELAVGAALGNLAEQVFVNVAHDVLVVQVEAVQRIHHAHQHTGRRHKEQRILHIAGEGSILAGMKLVLDEREHQLVHVLEHGFRLEMAEFAPAAILMRFVENGVDDFHVKSGRIGLLAQLVVVQNFDEHEVGDLLNHRQRIGHAGRPEDVPNAIDFVFQFAGNHTYLSLFFAVLRIFLIHSGFDARVHRLFCILGNCPDISNTAYSRDAFLRTKNLYTSIR